MPQEYSRRSAVQAGGLWGLSLPALLQGRAAAGEPSFGRARRLIMLYLHGGHPQQETFDPKPDGPSAVKGEFGATATSLPGIQFSELLPKSATLAHRMAIIRSMSHSNSNHVTASLPAKSATAVSGSAARTRRTGSTGRAGDSAE